MARVYLYARRITPLIMNNRSDEVRVVDFSATRVATLEHRGDPAGLDDSVQKFIQWRRQNGLPPSISATINILDYKLQASEPDTLPFDLCAATDGEITENEFGVVAKTIPGGK